jgi:formylglycine-generating enzyme required for sulfatase activity
VDAIEKCDVFVFMISQESVLNKNCRAELTFARRLNRPILPVVLTDEFFYDPVKGKNDIRYWDDVPPEIYDIRAQLLFEEGTSFTERVNQAVARYQSEPDRWRPLQADRPADPSDGDSNYADSLYDEACDYAWRSEFATAERKFQILANRSDPHFSPVAYDWIVILRDYRKLVRLFSRSSTRFVAEQVWQTYQAHFPKPFIDGVFDPKRIAAAQDIAVEQAERDRIAAEQARRQKPPTVQTPSQPVLTPSDRLLPPPFAWIDIPGSKGKKWQGEPYKIARYPITNAQFKLFLDAGGYSERRWWTDAGWQQREEDGWTQPRHWTDSKWNGADKPVVGVSWYEAVAFCLWLSEATGEKIMLPTEAQWQYAAQGDDGRTYPWGNTWDHTKCNNYAKKEGGGLFGLFRGPLPDGHGQRTTPVTAYEGRGDSPFGVVDMAGNVWEWCLTDYNGNSNNINSNSNSRVLRGGSWDYGNPDRFRCDIRGRNNPHLRDDYGRGFRLSRS